MYYVIAIRSIICYNTAGIRLQQLQQDITRARNRRGVKSSRRRLRARGVAFTP